MKQRELTSGRSIPHNDGANNDVETNNDDEIIVDKNVDAIWTLNY